MLVLISEGATGSISYPVNQTIILVGRDDEADWLLESRQVSRKHCILVDGGDHLTVRDLGSTNGTFINGKRIQAGKARDGDLLSFGELNFRIQEIEASQKSPKPEPNPSLPNLDSHLSSQNYNRAVS